MRQRRVLWALIALGALVGACGKAPSASSESKGEVLAKVNDVEITVADFRREMERLPAHLKAAVATPEGQRQFLEDMIKRELLLQEAGRRKLDQRPDVVDRVADFRRRLLLEGLLSEEIEKKITLEDQEAKAYFTGHQEEFNGEQIHARHLLVRTEVEAKQVLDRLGKGEKFEELAKELSLDKASGQRGGDLQFFQRGQMVPEFEQAAFALKVGQVSGPVKSPFGYHIIRLEERRPGKPETYDQVKDQLQQRLLADKQRKHFDEWMGDLRQGAKITVVEKLLPVAAQAPGGPGAPEGKRTTP